ncbi:Glu-tRNA(Gln) amidotransferase subunit GatD [Candidatus Thorarchaeota archaeon]|nr:MAG: Glu-tRNA(Gln) amidotransferase subunit GatD [Candidatus Thorarchaeota archaeon]
MSLEDSGYKGTLLKKLASAGIQMGDKVRFKDDEKEIEGIIMPRSQIGADSHHLVLKLDSGYNLGLRVNESTILQKLKRKEKKSVSSKADIPESKDSSLPRVSILSTGGTIASKVDYLTGAVNPALTAQDLYESVPELRQHAQIDARVLLSELSENIEPKHWSKIARAVAKEIRKGVDGVVVAHGTDTLGLTSAALSFALQNLPVPVALVGSQRSSDRPSSDASMNLIGAIELVGRADIAEILVVMHGETDDSYVYAHRGTRVRKLHTSRRDAFRTVNDYPILKREEDEILEIGAPLLRRSPKRKLHVKPRFEGRVGLVKTYPGMSSDIIDHLVDTDYRGIVIEGSGLGHAPTRINGAIERAIKSELVVAMTSQCIFGRVDMNVYRSGVELLDLGVIPCEDMLPETALVKLMWLLANRKELDQVKSELTKPIVGEMEMRTEYAEYLDRQEAK